MFSLISFPVPSQHTTMFFIDLPHVKIENNITMQIESLALQINETWAMGFARDQLASGCKICVLTTVDTVSRFSLAVVTPTAAKNNALPFAAEGQCRARDCR